MTEKDLREINESIKKNINGNNKFFSKSNIIKFISLVVLFIGMYVAIKTDIAVIQTTLEIERRITDEFRQDVKNKLEKFDDELKEFFKERGNGGGK